jgi:prepilin-type N-terminal cleavage/methylation domain-containing protein
VKQITRFWPKAGFLQFDERDVMKKKKSPAPPSASRRSGWRKKGMTLMEIVIVIAVITLALLGIYSALALGVKMSIRAKHLTIAQQAAEQELEIIRSKLYSSLTNQTNGPFIGQVEGLDQLLQHSATLTITDYSTGIKRASVTISWKEGSGTKTIYLETLISQGGLND